MDATRIAHIDFLVGRDDLRATRIREVSCDTGCDAGEAILSVEARGVDAVAHTDRAFVDGSVRSGEGRIVSLHPE